MALMALNDDTRHYPTQWRRQKKLLLSWRANTFGPLYPWPQLGRD